MDYDRQFVLIAKALADPTRARMLREVRRAGELTCSDVCALFPQSQPTISHHIKTLDAAGLIRVRRKGQFHILAADDRALRRFIRALGAALPQPAAVARKPRRAKTVPHRV